MKLRNIITGTLSVALFASCSNDSFDPAPEPDYPLTPNETELMDGSFDFNGRLVSEFGRNNAGENWVISPFMTYNSVSMMANLLSEKDLVGYGNMFGLKEDSNLNLSTLNSYIYKINNRTENSFGDYYAWMGSGISLDKELKESLLENFLVEPIEVEGNVTESANDWWKSNFKVSDFFGSNNAQVVLANVLSLEMPWAFDQSSNDVVDVAFKNNDGSTVTVKGLEFGSPLSYCETTDWGKIVVLPLQNGSIQFYIPNGDFNEFVKSFAPVRPQYPLTQENASKISLLATVPFFEVEKSAFISTTLQTMGWNSYTQQSIGWKTPAATILKGVASVKISEEGAHSKTVKPSESREKLSCQGAETITINRPFAFSIHYYPYDLNVATGVVYNVKK